MSNISSQYHDLEKKIQYNKEKMITALEQQDAIEADKTIITRETERLKGKSMFSL